MTESNQQKNFLLTERGWHFLSVLLLLLLFIFYLVYWIIGNATLLFDPLFQNDDARTLLFPFHLYGPDQGLAHSVLAREMLGQNLPVLRFLYFVFVKLTDLFWASKIIQLLCLIVVFFSGYILSRSKRVGPAGGILLVFLLLHHFSVVNRMAGGLPRNFVFPFFSLWIAGLLTNNKGVRWASCLLFSLLYPPGMLMILGAEGIYCLRNGIRLRSAFFWLKVRSYFLLLISSFLLLAFSLFMVKNDGHVFNLKEASENQAFGQQGLMLSSEGLPFFNPAEYFAEYFFFPLSNLSNITDSDFENSRMFLLLSDRNISDAVSFFLVVVLLFLILARMAPSPKGLVPLIVSSMVFYVLARFFAFHLYLPERYYYYGMMTAGTLLAVSTMGLLFFRLKGIRRSIFRNFGSVIFITTLLVINGGGVFPNNGVTIEGYSRADLFYFIRSLPPHVRFLAHPMEADDILYWAGRDTMGGYETLHMFNVELWARRKREVEEVIQTIYSTNSSDFLAYCRRNGITHILVNKGFFGADFRERALYLEPFKSFARELLARINREDLLLIQVPPETVVYEEKLYQVVDVTQLEQVWNKF